MARLTDFVMVNMNFFMILALDQRISICFTSYQKFGFVFVSQLIPLTITSLSTKD